MAVESMRLPTLSWINGAEAVLLPATAAFAVLLVVSQLKASDPTGPDGLIRGDPTARTWAKNLGATCRNKVNHGESKAPNKQCCFQSIQSCSLTQYIDR